MSRGNRVFLQSLSSAVPAPRTNHNDNGRTDDHHVDLDDTARRRDHDDPRANNDDHSGDLPGRRRPV
jgi:hypothetical protein